MYIYTKNGEKVNIKLPKDRNKNDIICFEISIDYNDETVKNKTNNNS